MRTPSRMLGAGLFGVVLVVAGTLFPAAVADARGTRRIAVQAKGRVTLLGVELFTPDPFDPMTWSVAIRASAPLVTMKGRPIGVGEVTDLIHFTDHRISHETGTLAIRDRTYAFEGTMWFQITDRTPPSGAPGLITQGAMGHGEIAGGGTYEVSGWVETTPEEDGGLPVALVCYTFVLDVPAGEGPEVD